MRVRPPDESPAGRRGADEPIDRTRRRILTVLGGCLLGGGPVTSRPAAAQEVPEWEYFDTTVATETTGVDDYEFGVTGIAPDDGRPAVEFEADRVVVSGGRRVPRVLCDTYVLDAVGLADSGSTLEVAVRHVGPETYEEGGPGGCLSGTYPLGYRLEVPFDPGSLPDAVVLEEDHPAAFTMDPGVERTVETTVHRRDEADGAGIDVGGYAPRDLDGDGLYEDVDGTGKTGSNDVVVFFEHLEEPAVADDPARFDFNDSGGVGFDDVVALFELV